LSYCTALPKGAVRHRKVIGKNIPVNFWSTFDDAAAAEDLLEDSFGDLELSEYAFLDQC